MDTVKHIYNEKSWKVTSTVSDNNSFFHAAFGERTDETHPYLDKLSKQRRRRWAAFLNYYEDKPKTSRLADILQKCVLANGKHKTESVEDQDLFEGYYSDITNANCGVTMEEIPVLASLGNVTIVLFKDGGLEPLVINPDFGILGTFPNIKNPKGEVVLHLDGHIFSRMNPVHEESMTKGSETLNKSEDVTATKETAKQQESSGLMKYKKGGSAGSEGVQYQVGLLTIFFLNALRKKLANWKLSTENITAGKFDDIVLECMGGDTLLQAKHKQNKTKKITLEDLLSTNSKNDDFSIPKYFLSYVQIKKTFKLKEVIICTNASVDKKTMEFLTPQKNHPESMLHYENFDYKFYTFTDEILPFLKENMQNYYEKMSQNKCVEASSITEENIKDFLRYFQLYINYPPGKDVAKVIEQLLSQMKQLKSLYGQISPLEIYTKILEWFQQKDGVYLTELYAKAMFFEIIRDQHWQKLEEYSVFFKSNNLNFQDSKKIFHIVVNGGYLLHEIKVSYTVRNNTNKSLIVNTDDGIDNLKEVLEAFGLPQSTILILICPKVTEERVIKEASHKLGVILDKYRYKKIVLIAASNNEIPQLIGLSKDNYDIIYESITLADLSEDTQERLLKKRYVTFQGNDVNLVELVGIRASETFAEFLNSEELEKLVRDEKIKVGASLLGLNHHVEQFYIERKFERGVKKNDIGSENFNLRDATLSEELIYEMNNKVVLISDGAGTGKSTVLTNLALTIKRKHPHLWVIRIDFKDYSRVLKDFLEKDRKTMTILDLLDSKYSTKLTNELERWVFCLKEKVVLLLDGFDEISPDYTEIVLSLLSLIRQQPNFAKIFVTTRSHMSMELEKIFEIKPFALEPFTRQNQVDFLVNYWMHNLNIDDNSKGKCKAYAEAVIEKMCTWLQLFELESRHFAAIPLHIRMLAEIFQANFKFDEWEDWEGCKEFLTTNGVEPKLPANMNVTKLYKMFIDKKRSVYIDKGNPNGNTVANQALNEQFEESLVHHRNLALEQLVGTTRCELFACYQPTTSNVKTNVLMMGIVQKLHNELYFGHRTFAEFFVAEGLIAELQISNQNADFYRLLLEEMLLKEEYNVICVFFNCFLKDIVDDLSPKTFYNYQCHSYHMGFSHPDHTLNLLHRLAENGHVAILRLVLECADPSFATELPECWVKFLDRPLRQVIPDHGNVLNITHSRLQKNGLEIEHLFTRLTILEHAVMGGRLEMVKFLVKQGADIRNSTDLAAEKGHSEILAFLKEHGAGEDSHLDQPPIFKAVRQGQLDTITSLMQHGCDINDIDTDGNTALHVIARNPRLVPTAELLVNLEININAKNVDFDTTLHIAVAANNIALVELLVAAKADVNLDNGKGNTPLHVAALNHHVNIIKFLVEHKANMNGRNKDGYTALQFFVLQFFRGFENVEKELVKYSEYLNRLDVVRFFIEHGADVSVRGPDGDTVLHLAVRIHQLDIVVLLTEFRIDVNVKNNRGQTALDLAVLEGYKDIVEFLTQYCLES